jgi:hypothetical protein
METPSKLALQRKRRVEEFRSEMYALAIVLD